MTNPRLVQRKEYLDELLKLKDTHIIKVITGIRRCGKSTLLRLFKEDLLTKGVPEDRIIQINFEDPDNRRLLDWETLYGYLKSRLDTDDTTYFLLDEIQNVPDYQKAVDGLFIKDNADVYLTGSNAYMLSGEIATLLSGRYIEIKMLPLSFAEYVSFHGEGDLKRRYNDYVTSTSFPFGLSIAGDRKETFDYLDSLYSTVVRKDISVRGGIKDMKAFDSVADFLFDNIGNVTSANSIAEALRRNGRTLSVNTVDRYISLLTEAFVFYPVGRYDVKGMQYLETKEKYYAADLGMRFMKVGKENVDLGHILENVVFLELRRRGYRVNIGKVGASEIDFVAMNGSGITEYYQVAYSAMDNGTLQRELAPLEKVGDHNPKYLITMDEEPLQVHNGIRQVYALDWLLRRV